MRCITYGWVVLYLLILSILLMPINLFLESKTASTVSGGIMLVAFLGLMGWWITGFFSDCEDGYLGGLKRAEPGEFDKSE